MGTLGRHRSVTTILPRTVRRVENTALRSVRVLLYTYNFPLCVYIRAWVGKIFISTLRCCVSHCGMCIFGNYFAHIINVFVYTHISLVWIHAYVGTFFIEQYTCVGCLLFGDYVTQKSVRIIVYLRISLVCIRACMGGGGVIQ